MATRTIPSISTSTPPEMAAAGAACQVLLIGPEAAALAKAPASHAGCTCVDSFVEAILSVTPDSDAYALIVAGIDHDQANLYSAITAFRKVHPSGRLVLLCAAYQEPLCRRALAWGANDYFILPISFDQIWPLVGGQSVPPAAASDNGHSSADPARPIASDRMADLRAAGMLAAPDEPGAEPPEVQQAAAQLQLLYLPMVVQTALMNDVLQSTADLPARGLATLQSYFQWPGTLRIVPQAPPPEARDKMLCIPLQHEETDLGYLILENAAPTEPLSNQLSQAALWLAGWMVLAQRTRQLRELATTDELSGAYNRRYFIHFVTKLLDKARTGHFRVTLLYFDIDDFKRYNDVYGHAAGDTIIRDLIRLLRHCTRPHDLVARIGGDEFAVVFWDNEPPRQANSQHPRSALAVTERFRKAIASHDWQKASNITGQVSVSGGLATFPWDARTLDALMAAADANLLKAKQQGKNVIILREPIDDEPVK